MLYSRGSVIIVEHQIFYDLKSNKHIVDHSNRRPAIVISEDDYYFYYLTMTSKPGKSRVSFKLSGKNQNASIRNIYKKPIYGAIEVDFLEEKEFLKILKATYDFHKNINQGEFKTIKNDLLNTINKISGDVHKSK